MINNKKRLFVTIFFLFLVVPIYLYAQQENADDNSLKSKTQDTEKQSEKETKGKQPPPESEINVPGDVVYFKTGKKMKGVQVLRELPDKIEVQATPNSEPFYIPRRLVQSIEYDNIDPLREKIQKEIASSQQTDESVIPGEELSQEFNQKMRAPLSDTVISYNNEGLLKILSDLTQKVGVKLEVDDSIKTIPVEERRRSFEIQPGTSLYKFLQTDFASAYPNIQVTYKYDKIYISLQNTSSPSTNNSQ